MNLLLVQEGDLLAADRIEIRGRRLQQIREVLGAQPGDTVKVGMLNGLMGEGRILTINEELAELQVSFSQPPPAKLPLTLLLAMPRPKMFRRILQHCATLGVSEIILLNSYRVEKSFW